MSVRAVLVFLLVMIVMAILRGPAFRRGLRRLLGIPVSSSRNRKNRD